MFRKIYCWKSLGALEETSSSLLRIPAGKWSDGAPLYKEGGGGPKLTEPVVWSIPRIRYCIILTVPLKITIPHQLAC